MVNIIKIFKISFFCLTAIWALFLADCGSKKEKTAKETQMPQVSSEISADTYDVFKEFYSEETPTPTTTKSSTKKKVETFSTSSSSLQSSSEYNFSPSGRYVVQVSCVKSKSFANSLASKFQEMGYPAYVAEVQNPTPELVGTYYRVRIGGFDGISQARSFAEDILVSRGYDYWIDNKSNDNVGMEGYGLGSSGGSSDYYSSPASTSSYGSSTSSYYTTPSTTPTQTTTQPSSPTTTPATTESQTTTPVQQQSPSSGSQSGGSSGWESEGGW